MSDRFVGVDIQYDDKEWGNIIDPTEWNDNFLEIEEAFNNLVAELNSGIITDEDKQVYNAVYGETTSFDLASALALDKIVNVVYSNKTYYLMAIDGTKYIFYNFSHNASTGLVSMNQIVCDEDVWSQTSTDIPSIAYLGEVYATKTYVQNAIDNIPPSLTMEVDGQRLIFTEN